MRAGVFLFLFLLVSPSFAQTDSRHSLGIGLSRFGISAAFRSDKPPKPLNAVSLKYTGFYLEAGNIQHPREIAVVNSLFQNASSYKVDKTHYVWSFRPGLIYAHTLSERTDRRSVGLNLISGPGISIGYAWPVYVTILQTDPFGNEYFTNVRYNPDIHKTTEIAGRAGFSEGFSEGKLIPGITWQGGLDFQWANYRNDVNTLTLGARVEAFPRKLPILHNNALNRSIFSSFYINFAFGLGN